MTSRKAPSTTCSSARFVKVAGNYLEKDMLDRLNETDLGHKLASYVENFIVADEKAAEPEAEGVHAGQPDFKHHVDVWNCTHFMWRRSPKE